jgi:hypothetical protein
MLVGLRSPVPAPSLTLPDVEVVPVGVPDKRDLGFYFPDPESRYVLLRRHMCAMQEFKFPRRDRTVSEASCIAASTSALLAPLKLFLIFVSTAVAEQGAAGLLPAVPQPCRRRVQFAGTTGKEASH